MPLTLVEMILVITVLAAVIGFSLVRSAGKGSEPGAGGVMRVCPNPNCRYANASRASFCARCGVRL